MIIEILVVILAIANIYLIYRFRKMEVMFDDNFDSIADWVNDRFEEEKKLQKSQY